MHSDKGRDLVDAFAGAVLDDLQHTDGRERLRRRSVDYAGEGAVHMGYSGYPSDSERDYRGKCGAIAVFVCVRVRACICLSACLSVCRQWSTRTCASVHLERSSIDKHTHIPNTLCC